MSDARTTCRHPGLFAAARRARHTAGAVFLALYLGILFCEGCICRVISVLDVGSHCVFALFVSGAPFRFIYLLVLFPLFFARPLSFVGVIFCRSGVFALILRRSVCEGCIHASSSIFVSSESLYLCLLGLQRNLSFFFFPYFLFPSMARYPASAVFFALNFG